MKKIFIFLLLLFFPIKVNAITASSYIVMDMDSGLVLGGSNIHKKSLIASITKIMTAYLAINYGNLNEKIIVEEEVLKAYGSAIYIEIGEQLTLKELLYGLMLRSGNDAAYVIAKNISGNMSKFADLMNKTAKKLGMKDTYFYNAHGLEENNGNANTSTVYDMAILTKEVMKNKYYREIVNTKKITVKSNFKTYIWYNKNRLLNEYKYTTGGKTGFTKKARRTLVTTASKDNKNLIIITFNDGNDFNDHHLLYESYFQNYEKQIVFDKKKYQKTLNGHTLYLKNSYTILTNKNEQNDIEIKETITESKIYSNNQKVGELTIYLNKQLIHTESIYLNKKIIKKDNFISRIWRKIKLWLT